MATSIELLASYWTLGGGAQPHTDREFSTFDFKDRVEAAARVGFKGFGIWHADLAYVLKKRSLKEMKKILDDNGIRHLELEFINDWFLDGEKKKASDKTRKLLLDAAQALGARHVKVGDFFRTECPMPKMAAAYADLCRDAARHGTRIVYEMMPFSTIDSVEKVLQLIETAGESNGGVCFDLWHIAKLKIPYEKVARAAAKGVVAVEINDGTHEIPWELHEDTINHRRFCGEGEFQPKRFVEGLLKAGYSGPWGIEVLNQEARSWPLEKVVSHAFRTTMAQFPG